MSRTSGGCRTATGRQPPRHESTKTTKPRMDRPAFRVCACFGSSSLRIARPPRRLRHHTGQVRAAEHVVERGELAVEDLVELALRSLEALLEILLDRHLLVRRLEIAAAEAVGDVAEL